MMKMLCLCFATIPMLVSCGAPGDGGASAEDASEHWRSAWVSSNGVRLHYWRTGGEGKPVMIMAHGITDYGLNWTSLAAEFQDEYDIIMYDARGHGFSDMPPGGPYDLATHVEDLVGLVEALGIDSPILMGHSMGGSTVAKAAALHPEMFRALILEDPADMLAQTSPLMEDVVPEWKEMVATDRNRPKKNLMKEARTKRHPGWADIEYSRWADSKKLVDPDVVDILHGEGFGDAAETYPKIIIPTLVLKADADEATREKHREIASLLKNGMLVHIDGAGHVVRQDRPEETEREIRSFLATLDGAAREP